MTNARKSPWVLRALAAGLVAFSVGVALGASRYFSLPGAMRMDWALMIPAIVGYAALTGALAGLGLGGGMSIAVRKGGARVTLARLLMGSTLGGALGGTLPAVIGIAGFGAQTGPYAGTANILGSSLLAATIFVALWAPHLHQDGRLGALPRLGLSALASTLAVASVGTLCWLLHQQLDLLPTFQQMEALAHAWGLIPLALALGVILSAAAGLIIGLATWLYFSLAMAFDRTL